MNAVELFLASMGEQPLAEHERAVAAVEAMLPLERYAEVCAAIWHYRPEQESEVLARLGVDGVRWGDIDARWTDALQCRGYSLDEPLALRFTRAFMRKRGELREKSPRIRKLGPLPIVPLSPLPPVETGPTIAEAAPDPRSPTDTPTFMRAEAARAEAPRPSSGPPAAPSLVVAPPTLIPSPLALRAPTSGPPSPAISAMASETAAIDVSLLLKQAVPFDPHASSTLPEPGLAVKLPDPRAGYSDETTEFNFSDILKMGAPVPFAAKPPPQETADLPGVESPSQLRRLVRFDPQTGAPLALPRWEDLPATTTKK